MQTARSVRVCITFARWGFPIVREGYFLGGCHDKDFNIFGSILESAVFGTLRNEFLSDVGFNLLLWSKLLCNLTWTNRRTVGE